MNVQHANAVRAAQHHDMPENGLVALTYNLSWAVAKNQKSGSELHFVTDMCFDKEIGFCRKNAMQSLQKMENRPHIIAFQEYMPWDRKMLARLNERDGVFVETVPLDCTHIVAPDTELGTIMAKGANVVGYIAGIQSDRFFASLCTCWDTKKLGAMKQHRCLELSDGTDLRPCYIALTGLGYLLINMQAPQPDTKSLLDCMLIVNTSCEQMLSNQERANVRAIVLLGDFNDGGNLFSTNFVKLIGKSLLPPKNLKTCCYDPVHGMDKEKKYQFAGDYVMSTLQNYEATSRVLFDGSLSTEDATAPSQNEGRSDHDPVVAFFKP